MMDVAGYSRLTEADVVGTHDRFRAIMLDIVEPSVAAAAGRIVRGTGDGAVIELPSATDAMRVAMQIQERIGAFEAGQPAERAIKIRIGINLGDIIVDGNDIYGDGVNIAARLEALGRPGDIIVSESAMQTADGNLCKFTDLGIHRLKNINRPVRAYRVLPVGAPMASDSPDPPLEYITGFMNRPAIAVLPLRYRSVDGTNQEHLVDGITEDIIIALSRWRFVPVIARGSSFAYKNRIADPIDVGQQLGARYILDGSIRRIGHQVRVSISLVDVETTENLLSDQYQFGIGDIAAIQDEIVAAIVGAIEPELLKSERERAVRTPVQNSNAYELFLRGMWHHSQYTEADNEKARGFFEQTLTIVPAYAHASAALSLALVHATNVGWAGGRHDRFLDEAMQHAHRAVRDDPRDPLAYLARGTAQLALGSLDDALSSLREATVLDPSHAAAHANLSLAYNYLDRPAMARPRIELALRLSPHDPRKFQWLPFLAISHYLQGNYRDALVAAQDAFIARPDYIVTLRCLAMILGQLGKTSEAQSIVALHRRIDSDLSGAVRYISTHYVPSAAEAMIDGLRKAGFM